MESIMIGRLMIIEFEFNSSEIVINELPNQQQAKQHEILYLLHEICNMKIYVAAAVLVVVDAIHETRGSK